MISEFPLFVFTTFAGIAAGAYFMNAFFPVSGNEKRPWLFRVVVLVSLAIGMLGSLLHLGRPERFLGALSNPAAGIAQEAYLSIILGIIVLIDLILIITKGKANRPLQIVGAVVAFVFMFIMGHAYTGMTNIPAWTSPITILLFLVGDIAMGTALVCLMDKAVHVKDTFCWAAIIAFVAAAVVFVAESVVFKGVGLSATPFIVATIAMVAAIAVAAFAKKKEGTVLPAVVFCLAVVGVLIARYAFYAVA